MLDVRRAAIRLRRGGGRAGPSWRRSAPAARAGPRPRRAASASWPPSGTRCAARSSQLSKQVGALRRHGGQDARPRPCRTRAGELGDREQALDAQAGAVADELRDLLLRIPNVPARRRPRRSRRSRQRGACGSRTSTRTRTSRTSGCRTGTSAPSWASSTSSGGPRSRGRCSCCSAGPGGHVEPGAVPARPRPQPRPVRGDPPAQPGAHPHAHRHRPAAQVRRRRLPPRTRRPVGHPHRRGAAHLDGHGRDPRARTSCRCA